ncbi:hypothetical protein HanRHA438_Chr02g0064601 [Helianthus annuus]|nr:hypothetical protein HanRHA438_Chr02g0064601 [Helianthus annuus]
MSSSFGNSWADQWDHNPDPMPASSTYTKKKTGGGIGKTKEVAATGAKKSPARVQEKTLLRSIRDIIDLPRSIATNKAMTFWS